MSEDLKIGIRKADVSDTEVLNKCNRRNLAENYDLDIWKMIVTRGLVFVLEVENKKEIKAETIGYIALTMDEHRTLCLSSLAVDEDYRRNGLAQMLFKCGTDIIKSGTVDEIILNVRISNQPAISLYRKLGFEVKEIIEEYYEDPVEDGYEMVKKWSK